MRTHSKAFSLREAKGCCATFFSSMGGGSDLGTTSADQDSICGYLSGDYVCRSAPFFPLLLVKLCHNFLTLAYVRES